MKTPLITERLLRSFPPRIRERGQRYFRQGRVRLLGVTPDMAHGTVRGSARYVVSIERLGKDAQTPPAMACTCPYWEDHGVCKHLYAAALAARERSGEDERASGGGGSGPSRAAEPEWRRRLAGIRKHFADAADQRRGAEGTVRGRPLAKPLRYHVLVDRLRATGSVLVEVRAGDGRTFGNEAWLRSADRADRNVARLLLGAEGESRAGFHSSYHTPAAKRLFEIPPPLYGTALRRICETGRCTLVDGTGPHSDSPPATWDAGGAWKVRFAVEPSPAPGDARSGWRLRGWLVRGQERLPLEDASLVTAKGLALTTNGFSRLRVSGTWPLLLALRKGGPLVVPSDALFELAAQVALLPRPDVVELPEGAEVEEARPVPVPRLQVGRADAFSFPPFLPLRTAFDYDGLRVTGGRKNRALIDRERRRIVHRSPERERAARERLRALGAVERTDWRGGRSRRGLFVAPGRLDDLVSALVAEGWHVEADGRLYRAASATDARIRSGIDWFDLEGDVSFGDETVPLPEALAALGRGEHFVRLGDGSVGLLPLEWLRRYAPLAELATTDDEDGRIRFRRGQAALLDALLAEQPEVRVDQAFARLRQRLRGFERVRAAATPRGFRGELRPYQKEGLGWMRFLRRLELGGCLADDMGLGKTVQVLALLEKRRQEGAGPSLVVVPKSLVLNWMNEALRFAPHLRVRDHTGPGRHAQPLDSDTYDLAVTTYGTLRRDAPELADHEFDYVILDEAQAIKNAASATAKAARLLHGRHRLALSGTPIENHLGELWSLFEFLNPGMFGSAKAFAALRAGAGNGSQDPTARALLARALRPFLLRRTKEQVAPELPARTEQTVLVELKGEQKKLYDSLRDHYRRDLLGRVAKSGMSRSRMHVLEALLRLRQAALHPALLNSERSRASSAKLPLLMETLEEVVAEGHRALVFSQFTTFLALVREGLERARIPYEYLDGHSRDRQARVDRFQQDGGCPVFLISLRAGGHGLNLTAADYVFLLDPWWNPAVEAQAIDRTHRIGQTKPVVAMRLIAKDTVEEKVLALQQSKREAYWKLYIFARKRPPMYSFRLHSL